MLLLRLRKLKRSVTILLHEAANLGSSVGATKCSNRSDLQEGLMEAASFDRRVLVQKGVKGVREIEVSAPETITRSLRCPVRSCRAANFIRTN